jgi:threonine/homoserine/homoserine lactone efflux protein
VDRDTAFDDVWWRAGDPMMLIGISLGVTVYATIAVYGRVLAIATAPTLRRDT